MSVDHGPLYGRRIDRSLDHLRSRDRPTVGRDSIGSVSAIYRLTVGQVLIKYRSMHRPILDRTTRKGTRILSTKAKYKSASKIYRNSKGKDKQSVIGKGTTQEAC